MEVVENRFADVSKADGKCRIADEFLQGACIVGPEIANWQSLDLTAVRGRSLHDGKELASGTGANVMGNPLTSLAWLATQLLARGKTLRAGDLVLTGSTHVPQFLAGPGVAVSEFVGIGETRVTFQ
jgi:2-keto-4-pentenoate hydratase